MSFSDEEIEAARILFARPVHFLMGAAAIPQLPPADLPEIAFAGRSNVGKSSLINGLLNRKDLARASTEPGRTREVNFFVLDDVLRLVDLPGYGFARRSKAETAAWGTLIEGYLSNRVTLGTVVILIDVRARPLRPSSALMSDDLPTLERPAKAISAGPSGGRNSSAGTPRTKIQGLAKMSGSGEPVMARL